MRGTTLPELAKTELVEAFLEARMPMPTDVQGWKLLERQIADAISQIFTLHGLRSGCSTLLKEPVSLLLRDRRDRDYEFTAFVSDSGAQPAQPTLPQLSRTQELAVRALGRHCPWRGDWHLADADCCVLCAGGVHAELRVPFSADRGMWFTWDGDSESSPRTVCHPCPQCMTSSHNTLVELDGSVQLAAACLHHAAGRLAFPPARSTFEGDNLLVVPRYRCERSAVLLALTPHKGGMHGMSAPEARARVWGREHT